MIKYKLIKVVEEANQKFGLNLPVSNDPNQSINSLREVVEFYSSDYDSELSKMFVSYIWRVIEGELVTDKEAEVLAKEQEARFLVAEADFKAKPNKEKAYALADLRASRYNYNFTCPAWISKSEQRKMACEQLLRDHLVEMPTELRGIANQILVELVN